MLKIGIKTIQNTGVSFRKYSTRRCGKRLQAEHDLIHGSNHGIPDEEGEEEDVLPTTTHLVGVGTTPAAVGAGEAARVRRRQRRGGGGGGGGERLVIAGLGPGDRPPERAAGGSEQRRRSHSFFSSLFFLFRWG